MSGLHEVHLLEWSMPQPGFPAGQLLPQMHLQRNLIAIIDDSPTVRKVIETCLRREQYAVIAFNTGIDAVRWYQEQLQAPIPALIFLDITMPKMDGYQVAQTLKRDLRFAASVLIMLSRHAGLLERIKARLAGCQAYLTKPCPTEKLVQTVHTYLEDPAMAERREADGSCEW